MPLCRLESQSRAFRQIKVALFKRGSDLAMCVFLAVREEGQGPTHTHTLSHTHTLFNCGLLWPSRRDGRAKELPAAARSRCLSSVLDIHVC